MRQRCAMIEALCARYELLLSRFNPESRLSALNAAAGEWVDVGNELAAVLRVALGYCGRTGGLFDITMGGVCRLWDFKRGIVPDDAAIAEALAHVDWRNVQVEGTQARIADPQATIDLGGMAKGYIADRVINLLKCRGATTSVVNLGGNVACLGSKPDGSAWNVGLRAPVPSGGSLQAASFTSVPVRGKSVVTSGVYERVLRAQRPRAPPHPGPSNGQTSGNGCIVCNCHSRQVAGRRRLHHRARHHGRRAGPSLRRAKPRHRSHPPNHQRPPAKNHRLAR